MADDTKKQAEALKVLKMDTYNRQKHYQSVLTSQGIKAVNELIAEVKKQSRIRSNEMEM